MQPVRSLSRRSFLAAVAGTSGLALAGCAATGPRGETTHWDPLENAGPRDRGRLRRGRDARRERCSDEDAGSRSDPAGRGRRCAPGRARPSGN